MNADTPRDCHQIAKELNRIIDLNDWHKNHALKIMADGVKAKFDQNEHLNKLLLDTGDKRLVECNPYDSFWSCGLILKDNERILDTQNWPGDNKLGNILKYVRDGFQV